MPLSDEILLERSRAGNHLAFLQLYERYKRAIYGFTRKLLEDPELAKDVLQTVFLRLYEDAGRIHNPSHLKTWLFAVARNECLTQRRKSSRNLPLEGDEPIVSDGAHDALERDERHALIRVAIGRLTPEQREVVVLREYEDLSYREIAEIIGVAESVVKSRLFEARRKLFDLLKNVFQERST